MNTLIVDDSKMIRHILIHTLRELGYNTFFDSANVAEAKSILLREKIDLVISDWNMPGESGLDLLKKIRSTKELTEIPFIIISSESNKSKIFNAIKVGVQAYLVKPIKKEQLVEKLNALVKTHGIQAPIVQPQEKHSVHALSDKDIVKEKEVVVIKDAPHLGIQLDKNEYIISVDAAQQEDLSQFLPKLFPGANYLYITSNEVDNKYLMNIELWKKSLTKDKEGD